MAKKARFPALKTKYRNSVGVTGKPYTGISQSFREVARLIGARKVLKNERNVFALSHANWDSHSDQTLPGTMRHYQMLEIDHAIKLFVTELKAQGMWDSVTLARPAPFAFFSFRTRNTTTYSDRVETGPY